MKKVVAIILLALWALTGCYDDYRMDYDKIAVYVTYQYDLRTFVIGEDMEFDFTVALAGALKNNRKRAVNVVVDDSLLTKNLAIFTDTKNTRNFNALDGLTGKAPFGAVCQPYVISEVSEQNLAELTPLPDEYYQTNGIEGLAIEKDRHTAVVTVSANQKILNDTKALKPYYAIAFRISDADADMVIKEKSFEIIAVKCENKFWGNWYHGGTTIVKNDLTGETVTESIYPFTIPQSNDRVYSLSTIAANAVVTNKMGKYPGSLKLTFDGDQIHIESSDGLKQIRAITGIPSSFNGAKLLQERKLFLNYSFSNGDGTTTFITDTLAFRNRIRDGVNEWQDENEKNY